MRITPAVRDGPKPNVSKEHATAEDMGITDVDSEKPGVTCCGMKRQKAESPCNWASCTFSLRLFCRQIPGKV
jgi:hypothetical protein